MPKKLKQLVAMSNESTIMEDDMHFSMQWLFFEDDLVPRRRNSASNSLPNLPWYFSRILLTFFLNQLKLCDVNKSIEITQLVVLVELATFGSSVQTNSTVHLQPSFQVFVLVPPSQTVMQGMQQVYSLDTQIFQTEDTKMLSNIGIYVKPFGGLDIPLMPLRSLNIKQL